MAVVNLKQAAVGVWTLLSASWILLPGSGFVTDSVSTEKTYGIHRVARVSFCLPCVILTPATLQRRRITLTTKKTEV